MESKEYFEKLLKAASPSGYETEATNVFREYCKQFCDDQYGFSEEFVDNSGNVVFSHCLLPRTDESILISGHIDTPLGLQVSYINDSGLIHFIALGGVDRKVLPGSRVTIINENGKIPGIISKKPIHCESDDEYGSIIKIKDLTIDIGAEDKEEAESKVSIGDVVVINSDPIMDFGKNRIVSGGLDDKVSVYIVSEVFRNLCEGKVEHLSRKVYVAAVVNEEIGTMGAKILANRLNPNISIDLDVTFATDDGRGVEKEVYGDIKLGRGPVIEMGPDKNPILVKLAKDTAKKYDIPVQFGVSRPGGTNTNSFRLHSSNCMTSLISIPQRGMHVGNSEMCDWRDIDGAIKLLTHMILDLN